MKQSAKPGRWIPVRIIISTALLLGLFAVVGYRAYGLQVRDSRRLKEMAAQQYLKQIELPPRRGTIYDRHGAPLAVSVDVDSIFANPRMIGSKAPAVARTLAGVLNLDPWALQRQLSSRRYFAWVKRRVSPKVARAVRALKIRGVFLTRESRRFYPNQGLGGKIVGFSGLDAKGLAGVEHAYDSLLRGNRQRVYGLRDAMGRSIFEGSKKDAQTGGHELVLALDRFIQLETERAVEQAHLTVKKETGWVSVVVMDPRSGDILAMATSPGFDPNHYSDTAPKDRRNRALTDAFEPGSTIKPFTVAAALQNGVVHANERFDCERGAWRVGRYVIHDSKPHRMLSLAEVLSKSSNIGVSKIAFAVGKPELYRALRAFGFARRTGIKLPGERAGRLRRPNRWSDVGLANISFGQGITTTVLQLARAFSAIANGGRLMKPRLLLRVQGPMGEAVRTIPPRGRQVIRRDVADTVRRMLIGVTRPGGTAVEAALDHYTVAGKTGTAQKVDPKTGTYSKENWIASFIGMAPASRPRLVVAVVVNDPAGETHYGGDVAGPIFRRITGRALRYLGIKPDRRAPKQRKKPTQRAAGVSDAPELSIAPAVTLDPAPPLPDQRRKRGRILVPDFTGLSIAEAIEAARRAELRVIFSGSGRAVAQSPGPGPARSGTLCRVSFSPPG